MSWSNKVRNSENPWNKNKNPQARNVQKPQNGNSKTRNQPNSSEDKFKEAQRRLQEAVQKHVKEYDSSSEEEEVEAESIIGTYYLPLWIFTIS